MRVFHPYALSLMAPYEKSGRPFAHYTGAEAAVKIIESREFWMRKSSSMNDFREIEHGLGCIKRAYESDQGRQLNALLDSHFPGIADRIRSRFFIEQEQIRERTFIACISEHGDDKGEEDVHGRLSMWRAYGLNRGVALLLNPNVVFNADMQGVFSSPVAYLREPEFIRKLAEVNQAVEQQPSYIGSLGPAQIERAIVNMLQFAAICAKHPGFSDEREWRIIHTPWFGDAPNLISHRTTVGGKEQDILRLPFGELFTVDSLIQKIIVGPTEAPEKVKSMLVGALQRADVDNPEAKIVMSDIPLRT